MAQAGAKVWAKRTVIGAALLATAAGVGFAAREEMRTSRLQARLLSAYAQSMTVTLKEGPNPAARYPAQGPYNERFGYSALPDQLKALTGDLYSVEAQAVLSPALDRFMAGGGFPIYREKTQAGLTLLDRNGHTMYSARYPERVFARFEDVPPLVADTLLFIENRELLNADEPRRNPAVEWERFLGAVAMLPLQVIRPGQRSPGGSTLATQTEKYRHSPDGQTTGGLEKLRQMASASIRAYRDGEDTTQARRRILVDYLNSTPLTARAGFGEVNGLGDGLWAWFGTDLAIAERVLGEPATDARALKLKALAYKQVLALLLAQRRPSHYLIQDRAALDRLADSHLRVLAAAGVIDEPLRDAALALPLSFAEDPPSAPATSFVEQKATNAIRARLLSMLTVPSLYQLDRLDLTAQSTLDAPAQQRVVEVLGKLNDPAYAQSLGLTGERLLDARTSDLSKIVYSVTLYERGPEANYLRVQADNLDQPLDINEGAKLDLGSTAKLRTLVTYLEIVAELHGRYAHLPREFLADVAEEASDNLTRWSAEWLAAAPDRGLPAMLGAAMERRYSANPGETFFTGGGQHAFVNFNKDDNGRIMTIQEALRNSVNLPFIRLMRDVVQFYMADGGDDSHDILDDPDHPARQAYLARFADKEGTDFLNRFYNDYRKRTPDEALARLASRSRPVPHRLAVIFRNTRPTAGLAEFAAFLRAQPAGAKLDDREIGILYSKYGPDKFPLNDLGYLARVHPLELWLVAHLQKHPDAKRAEVLEASAQVRQDSYRWLFKKGKAAQNTRIRIGLEEEAFQRITEQWRSVGYPFETLVPSLATAIGSSADRPAALAELVGLVLNDGVRQPTVRVKALHFAADTPYEAKLGLGPLEGKRVLRPEVCATVRRALMDVAQNGTAKRVWGVFKDANGAPIPMGGKTGTGDHRLDRWGPGGVLLESKAVNRTATFAFYIGDRFFGTMTAFVHGPEADNYRFTSALPAQLLKSIAPALQPLIDQETTRTADTRRVPAGL
ncbi:transglycosylase domain-containing protein [Azospirillum doebereinerae]|uniref:peptidoglycan glycosyltransferase n=1 Tax=Azospirillum doebereinerae TaxID=92933 RepID=A0A433JF02_9PROT|nr:transglycosylase domain-containing protein [Azospirillum doebereinerae]MCG5239071.1 transglycosylase domain-containing protein [Azospirillum doebereinerae]RUQ75729.1 glycosyl transferase family 51 [Azospirillum doebereinerae]